MSRALIDNEYINNNLMKKAILVFFFLFPLFSYASIDYFELYPSYPADLYLSNSNMPQVSVFGVLGYTDDPVYDQMIGYVIDNNTCEWSNVVGTFNSQLISGNSQINFSKNFENVGDNVSCLILGLDNGAEWVYYPIVEETPYLYSVVDTPTGGQDFSYGDSLIILILLMILTILFFDTLKNWIFGVKIEQPVKMKYEK